MQLCAHERLKIYQGTFTIKIFDVHTILRINNKNIKNRCFNTGRFVLENRF